MKTNELIIINDWDKPCRRLLMGMKPNGKALYLNNEIKSHYKTDFDLQPTSATLEQFGFVCEYNVLADDWQYTKVKESTVKYHNGTIRQWQDVETFTYKEIATAEY